MKKILILIKKRLYIFVFIDFLVALTVGYFFDFKQINIKPISIFAVFIMLYPMLTGMVIEKVKKASKNIKLIILTLIFAFIIASLSAFLISRTILKSQPDIAFAMIMIGAIPCSNMLIGWSGIADASIEDAFVIAIIGLLLIPFVSPLIIKLSGGTLMNFHTDTLIITLLLYIFIPLILGMLTRKTIIKKKGKEYFMEIKKIFPGISASGILIIVFFSVAKVARIVIENPIIFAIILIGLLSYYLIQTFLSILAAKFFKLNYQQGMILVLGATASSQAISLSIAATMFNDLTVFALSFKPIIQVFYIMILIFQVGPLMKKFLNSNNSIKSKIK